MEDAAMLWIKSSWTFAMLLVFFGQASRAAVVAETGFNDALGINSNGTTDSPYELNATAHGQGAGETGWLGTWQVVSGPVTNSNVQNTVTLEGDGALHAQPTTNTYRSWAAPQSGIFTVEQYLRFTENSRSVIYLYESSGGVISAGESGPVWNAFPDGTVSVNDGIGDGGGMIEDTGFDWEADVWHKFTTLVDVPSQTYRFFMDGNEYLAPDPLGFRGAPTSIDSINYLAEVSGSGTYIDSLRIVPEPSTFMLVAIGLLGMLACRWRKFRC
jgi:hypothetical protein